MLSPDDYWFWFVLVAVGVNQIILGLFTRFLAFEKNRDGAVWFWLGLLIGPLPLPLLTLIGLPVVPDDEANHKRYWLLFSRPDRLKSITVDEASVLATTIFVELSLAGLTTLSDEAATALARHEGSLYLSGLTKLSDEVATALARHEGSLYLSGLTTLSDKAAQALGQHKGVLSLNGLTTLSDEAAKALSQHEGELSLGGLTTLTDEAAKALRSHYFIRFPESFRR